MFGDEQNCLRYLWNESCYKCDFNYEENIIVTLRTLQNEFDGILSSEASIQTKIQETAECWFDAVETIELPPGWGTRVTEDGRKYYVDHNTKSTHWELPKPLVKNLGDAVFFADPTPVFYKMLRHQRVLLNEQHGKQLWWWQRWGSSFDDMWNSQFPTVDVNEFPDVVNKKSETKKEQAVATVTYKKGTKLYGTYPVTCTDTDGILKARYCEDTGKTGKYFSTGKFIPLGMILEYDKAMNLWTFELSEDVKCYEGKYSFREIEADRFANGFINVHPIKSYNHSDDDMWPIHDLFGSPFMRLWDGTEAEVFLTEESLKNVKVIACEDISVEEAETLVRDELEKKERERQRKDKWERP